ncbi:MAG TPA: acyl-ACP--UDP-N-acetylglucosamine O-acyltransferase [Trueperaceae bacterium]
MTVRISVDPSAVVSPAARIADDVEVGPFVVIEADVVVGPGSRIRTGSVLHSGSRLGGHCLVGPYAVVGGEPMDSAFRGEASLAVLGDGVVLREFVTVHRATGEGEQTTIGDGTLVMTYTHVSHNVQVGRKCVLTTSVQLGGHCRIGDRVTIGSNSILHQYCRIGDFAMFGAGSAGNQDFLPFVMARGNPARHFRLNKVGLQRNGIEGERYRLLERAVRALRHRDRETFAQLASTSSDVRLMAEFIEESRRGVARFQKGD